MNLVLLLCVLGASVVRLHASTKPNIVVFISDDHSQLDSHH